MQSNSPSSVIESLTAFADATRNFLLEVIRDFGADDCTSMAAALAYATIFSLPSVLLIAIFVASLILGPQAASGHIQSELSTTMGQQAAAEVQTIVANVASNRAGGVLATALGIVGLLVSATSLLMQLQSCLNRAWKVQTVGSGLRLFIMRRIRSALLLVGAGVLAIVSIAAGSLVTAFAHMLPFVFAIRLGELVTSILVFTLIFGSILKAMPDVKLNWRDVWVGGLFIALLFVVGKFMIGLYLGGAGKTSVYGAAGSLAMILLWTYYSFLILLLGVEFTQVWVRTHGRPVVPKAGAINLDRQSPAVA